MCDGNSLHFNVHTVNCVADVHKDDNSDSGEPELRKLEYSLTARPTKMKSVYMLQ